MILDCLPNLHLQPLFLHNKEQEERILVRQDNDAAPVEQKFSAFLIKMKEMRKIIIITCTI